MQHWQIYCQCCFFCNAQKYNEGKRGPETVCRKGEATRTEIPYGPEISRKRLDRIYDEDYYIEKGVKGVVRLGAPKLGDVELYPNRYYLKAAFDILKLVYFVLRGKRKVG